MATTIEKTLRVLRDSDSTITAAAIYSLSDIGDGDLAEFKAGWLSIPTERRLQLLQRLGEISETNFDMNFADVTRLALADADENIRQAGIEALWYDESPNLMRRLMILAKGDEAENVRAEALSALGRFILMGELGTLDAQSAREAQDVALAIYNDPDELTQVRRRAVEALGNCTREGVAELIQEAYDSDELPMKASALFAMGRSCDDDWADLVLQELTAEDPELRYEAARATGDLELEDAIPVLADLLRDDDREVMEMAVWALGEIGGNASRHMLENASEEAEIINDEGLMEAITEALENASLVGESLRFDD